MASMPDPSPEPAGEQEPVLGSQKEAATDGRAPESLYLGPKVSLVLEKDDLVVTGM